MRAFSFFHGTGRKSMATSLRVKLVLFASPNMSRHAVSSPAPASLAARRLLAVLRKSLPLAGATLAALPALFPNAARAQLIIDYDQTISTDTAFGENTSVASGATLTLDGGTHSSNHLSVGSGRFGGSGHLVMTNGASLTETGSFSVGLDSFASVIVTGPGTLLHASNTTTTSLSHPAFGIGNASVTATVTVSAGGAIQVDGAALVGGSTLDETLDAGVNAGLATLNVTGAGSSFSAGTMAVGYVTEGRVNVAAGGSLSVGTLWMSYPTANASSLTVSGAGSHANIGALHLGYQASSTLTVADGGKLSANTLDLAGPGSSANAPLFINVGAAAGDSAAPAGILDLPSVVVPSYRTLALQLNTTHTAGSPAYLTRDGTVSGTPVNFSGPVHLTNTAGYNVLAGSVSSSGPLAVNGGTLVIANTATFAGDINITGGTLAVATGGDLANSGANIVVASTGVGAFVMNGGAASAGSVILGHDGGTATLTLNGGTLTTTEIARWSIPSTVAFDGGTLRAAANTSVLLNGFTGGSAVIASGGLTIDTDGHTVSTASELTGSGGLTKTGSGTLTLSGANAYTGATTVGAGTLRLTGATASDHFDVNGGALELTAPIALGATTVSGGVLDLGGVSHTGTIALSGGTVQNGSLPLSQISATSGTIAADLTGADGFTKTGGGTLTFSGANTYTGATTVDAGTLRLTGSTTTDHFAVNGGTLELAAPTALGATTVSGGVLDLGGVSHTGTIALSGGTIQNGSFPSSQLSANAGTISADLTGSGVFTKTGSGTLTLSGPNTYTGGTAINAGTLVVATGGSIGHADTDIAIADTGAAAFTLTGGSVAARALVLGFSGGTATVTLSGGTLTTTEVARWSGTSTVTFDGGTLRAAADTGLLLNGFTTGSAIIASGGLTIDTDGHSASTASALSGVGGLAKIGSGTLTLSGANSYTGGTAVNGGTLVVAAGGVINHPAADLVVADTGAASFIQTGGSATVRDLILGPNGHAAAVTLSGGLLVAENITRVSPGSTLTFDGGGLRATSDTGPVFNGFTAGSLTVASGGITFDTDGHSVVFSTPLSGVGGFTKSGSGMLTLSGGQAYTGITTVSAGTLRFTGSLATDHFAVNGGALELTAPSALGATTVSGGVLDLGGFSHTGSIALSGGTVQNGSLPTSQIIASGGTISAILTGSGGFTKTGSGTLTLSGANTYSGPTVVEGGDLIFASSQAFYGANSASWTAENLVVRSGATAHFPVGGTNGLTLSQFEQLAALSSPTGGFRPGSSIGIDTTQAGGPLTLSGDQFVSSNMGFAKTGANTLSITGNNTLHGGLKVSGGLLLLGPGTTIDTTAPLTVAPTAGLGLNGATATFGGIAGHGTVDLTGSNLVLDTATDAPLDAFLVGTGSLTKTGPGTLTTTNKTHSFSGGLTIAEGKLTAISSTLGASGSTITLAGGTLEVVGGALSGRPIVLANGGGSLYAGAGINSAYITPISGDSASALRKTGLGTVTLRVSSTYSGPTIVEAGHLSIFNTGALPNGANLTINAGASMGVRGSVNLSSLSGDGFINATGTVSLNHENAQTVSTIIAGTGNFRKSGSGTLTLTGINTLAPSPGLEGFNGMIFADAGSLIVNGSTASAWTQINAGATLGGSGTVGITRIAAGGTLSPGNSPGLLTVSGSLTLDPGSTTLIEIGGTTRGATYDALDVSGGLFLNGELRVLFTGGWTPAGAASFQVFQASSIGGSFAQYTLPYVSGYTWNTARLGEGVLELAAVPEPASCAMLAGLAAFGLAARRRRRAR